MSRGLSANMRAGLNAGTNTNKLLVVILGFQVGICTDRLYYPATVFNELFNGSSQGWTLWGCPCIESVFRIHKIFGCRSCEFVIVYGCVWCWCGLWYDYRWLCTANGSITAAFHTRPYVLTLCLLANPFKHDRGPGVVCALCFNFLVLIARVGCVAIFWLVFDVWQVVSIFCLSSSSHCFGNGSSHIY